MHDPSQSTVRDICMIQVIAMVILYARSKSKLMRSLCCIHDFILAPTVLAKNQRAFYALSWKRATVDARIDHGGIVYDSHICHDCCTLLLDLVKLSSILF